MRMSKSSFIYLSIAGALCLLIVAWFISYTHFKKPGDEGRTLILKYDFTVSNTTPRAINGVKLMAGTPIPTTSTQYCKKNNINQPSEIIKDDAGNTHFVLHWDLIPPYTTKVVSITSEVAVRERSRRSAPSPLPVYLAPEPFIESDHALIKETARSLKAKNVRKTARGIFDWVVENIRYAGYVKNNRGALYALKHRKGDCTEFATLFVALCRANGVPARYLGGFVSSKSAVLTLGDYHNWAEFYYDGRWHLADPQRKIFMNDQANEVYIAYKIIRPSEGIEDALLTNIKGTGLKVRANR